MFTDFDFGVILRSLPYLFKTGMVFTLQITLYAMVGGIFFGSLLAMMRLSRLTWVSRAATGYVNLMRSVPLILTIFWFYFLVPPIIERLTGSTEPVRINPFATSIIAFIIFEAAYYCEIIRSGIGSVRQGQIHAAQAVGMTERQTMQYIVLPQAFRAMIPVLLTQTILLFQDVSLVYVLSITDFVGAASKIAARDNRLPEMYLFVAVVYFFMSFGLSSLVRKLRRRLAAE